MEYNSNEISDGSLSLINYENNQIITDEEEQNNFEEEDENIETSFIDLNNYGVLNIEDSNMDDIRNLSMFGKMNSSMRDRRLNSSNQNERSLRKTNSKANYSNLISNNNNKNNNNDGEIKISNLNLINNRNDKVASGKENSNFKNEVKNFLKENNNLENVNKNDLVNLEKQKIIEINEEEDEKSVDNMHKSFTNKNANDHNNNNYNNDSIDADKNVKANLDVSQTNKNECMNNNKNKDSIFTNKNPLVKFENLYLQGKSENSNNKTNKYTQAADKENIKHSNNSQEVINHINNENEISENNVNKILNSINNVFKNNQINIIPTDKEIKEENIVSDLEKEDEDEEQEENEALDYEENGEIEVIFNNFEDKVEKENEILDKEQEEERVISPKEMSNMDKDELIKMILKSDLVKENNLNKNANYKDGAGKNNIIDFFPDVDDIADKIDFIKEEKNKNSNLNKNKNFNKEAVAAKNKFSFVPRKKNIENNNHQKEAVDIKPELPNNNNSENKSKNANEAANRLPAKEKASSPRKNNSQTKKGKENSVNKYVSKLKSNSNNVKSKEASAANIKQISNNNEKTKNDLNSKIKNPASKKSEESNSISNALFNNNNNYNIEKIEKKEEEEIENNIDKISEGISEEIEDKQDELDSKQILEMLLYNKTQLENEIDQFGNNRVDEKNKKWLEKKTKNLGMIQEKIDDEYKKICTFAPNTNNTDKKNRRNLEQFLNDQQDFQKKIAIKKQDLQSHKEKESLKENQTAPKINEYSKKLLEEKNANKDPVYQRLYNMKASKEEKALIDKTKSNKAIRNNSYEKNKKLKNKSTTHHSKNISNANINNNNNDLDKSNENDQVLLYNAVNTEENLQRKSLIKNNNIRKSKVISSKLVKKVDFTNFEINNNILNKKADKSAKDLQKSNSNKNINFKNPLENNSNKYIFNKYTALFRNIFEELFNEFINSGTELDYIKGVNKDFLLQLFDRLKLFEFPCNSENQEQDKLWSTEEIINSLKQTEKNLFYEVFENLRDSEAYVSIDHFYIFSLAILDLLDYYILKAYQEKEKEIEKEAKGKRNNLATTPSKVNSNNNHCNNATENFKSEKNANNFNFIVDKNTVDKINAELKAKIILSKKYGGYDEANNFIITFEHAKKIHKDFLCFSVNWYKSIRNSNKSKNKDLENLAAESVTFKPKINPKSAKIGEEYRRKVISELDVELKDKKNQNVNSLDYLEILNLKKKRQDKLNQKLKEEQIKETLKDCTFKPKINSNYKKDNVFQVDNNPVDRYNLLFKLGTQSIIQKKDKTRNDYEAEKYGDECTFKPNINTEFSPNFEAKNDFFSEKELEKFNDRMRKGRIDKEIKDSAFKRGEALYDPNQMKYKQLSKIINNNNKSEEKAFNRKNIENTNYRNIQKETSENAFEKYETDNIAKSCVIPNTTKNISNSNNMATFAEISPINNNNNGNKKKNLNEIRPYKLNFNSENEIINSNINNNQVKSSNQNHIQRKSLNENFFGDEAANRKPILIIDVKLKEGNMSYIKVYEGDTAEKLSNDFGDLNGLDNKMRGKLKKLVQNEINKLLTRIQEETSSMKNTMNDK